MRSVSIGYFELKCYDNGQEYGGHREIKQLSLKVTPEFGCPKLL